MKLFFIWVETTILSKRPPLGCGSVLTFRCDKRTLTKP